MHLQQQGSPRKIAPAWGVVLACATGFLCLLLVVLLRSAGVGGGAALQAVPRRLAADPQQVAGSSGGSLAAAGDGDTDLAATRALLQTWPADKPRACILILARNNDLNGVLSSVSQLERRFNAAAGYPYW